MVRAPVPVGFVRPSRRSVLVGFVRPSCRPVPVGFVRPSRRSVPVGFVRPSRLPVSVGFVRPSRRPGPAGFVRPSRRPVLVGFVWPSRRPAPVWLRSAKLSTCPIGFVRPKSCSVLGLGRGNVPRKLVSRPSAPPDLIRGFAREEPGPMGHRRLGSFCQDTGGARWVRFAKTAAGPAGFVSAKTPVGFWWVRSAKTSVGSRWICSANTPSGTVGFVSPKTAAGPGWVRLGKPSICRRWLRSGQNANTLLGALEHPGHEPAHAPSVQSLTFLSWVRFADFAKRFAADGARLLASSAFGFVRAKMPKRCPARQRRFPGEAQHAASRDALRPVIVADSELDTVPDKRCTTRAAVELAQTAYTCLRALALHRIRDTNRLMREALQSLNFLCWVRFADFAKRFAADDALPCQLCVWLCSGQNVKRARRVSGVSRAKRSTRLRVMRCDPGSFRIPSLTRSRTSASSRRYRCVAQFTALDDAPLWHECCNLSTLYLPTHFLLTHFIYRHTFLYFFADRPFNRHSFLGQCRKLLELSVAM